MHDCRSLAAGLLSAWITADKDMPFRKMSSWGLTAGLGNSHDSLHCCTLHSLAAVSLAAMDVVQAYELGQGLPSTFH